MKDNDEFVGNTLHKALSRHKYILVATIYDDLLWNECLKNIFSSLNQINFLQQFNMSILDKISLKWEGFEDNVMSAFARFRDVSDFSDVTLVCEDGQQLDAQRVVLSASSTFFMNILTKTKHPNPVIFMRGITLADLTAIVDFLYFGEAKVFQENLDDFLALAQDLGLEGLMGTESSEEGEMDVKKLSTIQKRSIGVKQESRESNCGQKQESDKKILKDCLKEETYQKTEENGDITTLDIQSLDTRIKSMMDIGQAMTEGSQKGKRTRICKECGKEGTMTCIMNHIEVRHITGVSHPCGQCGKMYATRNALHNHKTRSHSIQH